MEDKKIQKFIKRLFDIITSLVVLIVFFPIWIIVAILIKVTSPGPVFFYKIDQDYIRKFSKCISSEQ